MRMRIVSLAGCLLLPATSGWAHHAFAAEFDVTKPVNLRGIVTRMEWINPHAWIHIDVKGADGSVNNWMIECGAPNGLLRRGFTKASLPNGTEIVITGWRAKDDSFRANGGDITFPDGKKLFLGNTNAENSRENQEK